MEMLESVIGFVMLWGGATIFFLVLTYVSWLWLFLMGYKIEERDWDDKYWFRGVWNKEFMIPISGVILIVIMRLTADDDSFRDVFLENQEKGYWFW